MSLVWLLSERGYAAESGRTDLTGDIAGSDHAPVPPRSESDQPRLLSRRDAGTRIGRATGEPSRSENGRTVYCCAGCHRTFEFSTSAILHEFVCVERKGATELPPAAALPLDAHLERTPA